MINRTRLIRWIVLSIVLFGTLSAQAELSESVQLHWVEREYVWRYNPLNEPAWLPEGETLSILQDATRGWAACGITFRYAGVSGKQPGQMDGENVIGWKNNGKNYSAWTSWRARRNGHALEADITLYKNIFDIYRQKRIDAKLELRKSIVHELGHALGLTHSDQLGDAMLVKVRTRPEWQLPSENDIRRCLILYPQDL